MTFRYKAMTPDGVAAKGIIQAMDEYQAVQKIRETCPVITERVSWTSNLEDRR